MGRRGIVPTPTEILKLKGGYRPDRRKGEPMPVVLCEYPPPSWLTPRACEKWFELVPKLVAVRVLTVNDLDALAIYCHAFDEVLTCGEKLKEEGMVVYGDKGAPYQNPYVGIRNKALDRMRKYEAAFGMTPADRTRIRAEPEKKTNVASRKRA